MTRPADGWTELRMNGVSLVGAVAIAVIGAWMCWLGGN